MNLLSFLLIGMVLCDVVVIVTLYVVLKGLFKDTNDLRDEVRRIKRYLLEKD